MKKIKCLILLFLFSLLLFSLTPKSTAYEDRLPNPQVLIKCDLNTSHFDEFNNCAHELCDNYFKHARYIHIQQNGLRLTSPFFDDANLDLVLSDLNFLCIENISEITLLKLEELNITYKNKFLPHNFLTFTPYSENLIKDLSRKEKTFSGCYYEKVYKLDNWIIIANRVERSFCTFKTLDFNTHSKLNHFKTSLFLLKNPITDNLIYLAIYLVIYSLFFWIIIKYIFLKLIKVQKEKKLSHFFKPTKYKIIFTLILSAFTFLIYTNYIGRAFFFYFFGISSFLSLIISSILIFYLTSCFVEYNKNKPRTNRNR